MDEKLRTNLNKLVRRLEQEARELRGFTSKNTNCLASFREEENKQNQALGLQTAANDLRVLVMWR